MSLLHDFHFLRPTWLLALVPLALLLVMLWRRHLTSRSWQTVVDPQLLPHLLVGNTQRRDRWGIVLIALGGLLAITALAGPVWDKQKQPVFRRDSALVVLLDLSQSMNATDVAPSRLQMAKFKLRDLLTRRKEGETALVVYAAMPFTVTPLTSDTDNIQRQLNSLSPALMPAQGSRADRAIAQAQTLLQQAGASHGDVLLITDGIDNTPSSALHDSLKQLLAAGYRLSVLGVGSADGAPIPLPSGGFLQDADGAIVVAKFNGPSLAQLAKSGHGIYRQLRAGSDNDTDALSATFASKHGTPQGKKVEGMKSDQWRERGPWLLLPLLVLASLAFRRGYLLLLFFTLMIPMPRSAYALGWNELWQRPDQQGAKALANHQPEQAAKLFRDPQWQAAAHYRAGNYQAVLNALKGQQGAEADYNRGNALARLGKLSEAVSAYDQALKQDPQLTDAKYNRDLVQKWLKQQANPPQKPQQGEDKSSPGSKDKSQQGLGASPSPNSDHTQSPGNKAQEEASADKPQPNPTANTGNDGQKSPPPSSASANTAQKANQDQAEPKSAQQSASEQQAGAKRPLSESAVATGTKPPAEETVPDEEATTTRDTDTHEPPQKASASEQWLRRIPDDPGGLWRRKFLYQYKQAYQSQQSEKKPW